MVRIITTTFLLATVLMSCGGGKNKETTCNASNEGYKSGYEAGKTSIWNTPEDHMRECNNGAGMIGEVPECWKDGFRAAKQ